MEELAVRIAGNRLLLANIDYGVVDVIQPFVEGTVNTGDLLKILRIKVGPSASPFLALPAPRHRRMDRSPTIGTATVPIHPHPIPVVGVEALFSGPGLVHVTEFVADDEGQFAFGIREQLGQARG